MVMYFLLISDWVESYVDLYISMFIIYKLILSYFGTNAGLYTPLPP